MISVPDAASLPSVPRPMRRSNSRDDVRGKSVRETSGTAGRARCPPSPSARSPSPCPATPRPCGQSAAPATRPRGTPPSVDDAAEAERRERRHGEAAAAARCCRACRCPRRRTRAASGSSPMPTLSSTMRKTRGKARRGPPRLAVREVVGDTRVGERIEAIACLKSIWSVPAILDDHREAIEVLDASFELAAVHQADRARQAVRAARSSGTRPGCSAALGDLRSRGVRHQRTPEWRISARSTRPRRRARLARAVEPA